MELKALLQEMIDKKASDVFIVAGLPLTYTADGRQVRMDMAPLMPADTKELVDAIYELSGRNEQIFMDGHNHDDDFSFAVPGMGRFRVNVFRQRGSLGAVIRVIPFTLPNPADYHIPDDVMACADFQKGLVLVTGPAGAGKSTTLACIIDKLNKARTGHIITMEDPSSTCIATRAASSPSARFPPMSPPTPRRCAARCARRRTSSCSARCATRRPSAPL